MFTFLILILATATLVGGVVIFLHRLIHAQKQTTTLRFATDILKTTNSKALTPYATDASAFSITPQAVYYPKSAADIVRLVEHCRAERVTGKNSSLTVRAGGTCMSGGPLSASYIIDLKHLKGVTVDPLAKTATVEAGAMFRDIEDAAAKHSLMFAPYPSSHRLCGIGGMLGNNASGEKSLRYGATSDNVLELEVVLANGEITTISPTPLGEVTKKSDTQVLSLYNEYGVAIKEATGDVKKAASGYRLEKVVENDTFSTIPLFVGAQGTLGVITKAVLKLVPIPEHVALVAISAHSLSDISPIVSLAYEHNPEALETFDRNTLEKAREHLNTSTERLLPYINENAELVLLAEFSEDTADATSAQANAYLQKLHAHGFVAQLMTDATDIAAAWDVRRHSFLLMRDHNPTGHRAVPCIEDVIVPLAALGEFIEELRTILSRHAVHYGFHGHIGDGSLRIIPVFDFTDPEVDQKIIGLMREVFALVKRLRGNISADHSDGIIRSPFLKEFYGQELYETFVALKNIYDPDHIMNPGKKIGVPQSAIKTYLAK